MGKQLIVNQTLNECRAALLENGEIVDYLLERGTESTGDHPSVGNVYLGKVLRVLPGMQSAFIDIGYTKAAFLYVDDAYIPTLEEQRELQNKIKAGEVKPSRELLGEVIPDELSTFSEAVDMRFQANKAIDEVLKEGDTIVVQVAKEPISTKGPRVTRHITLAGRYIVFMPFIEHTGVSRRIESEEERDRLKTVLDSIKPEGTGVISRTVSEGQSYKVLKNDFNNLVKLWKDIQKKEETSKAPANLYRDLNFVQRVLRDITDDDVEEIIVDTRENQKESEKFVQKHLQNVKNAVKLYEGETPIFEHYSIDQEIERAISNKVYLKSGGSLNIDQTEALVSVDVNTGKFVGRKNLEETILKNNLEAVKEVAYQLRLRNCGGLIIIDFIDMDKEENRQAVYNALLEALKKDRAKTNVLPISGLGLIEMTRKRTRDTLARVMCKPCPYCEGVGRVKSVETVAYELLRELNKIMKKMRGAKVFIYAHPEVSTMLCDNEFNIIDTLEEKYGKSLVVRSENSYHIEQYEIFPQEF